MTTRSRFAGMLTKVPEVTLLFWIIKICATTLGETGGDALSMTFNLGYAISTGIFLAIFLVVVIAQVGARKYHRFLYWAVIVATRLAEGGGADLDDPKKERDFRNLGQHSGESGSRGHACT